MSRFGKTGHSWRPVAKVLILLENSWHGEMTAHGSAMLSASSPEDQDESALCYKISPFQAAFQSAKGFPTEYTEVGHLSAILTIARKVATN